MHRPAKIVIVILLSASLLWLAFHNIDLSLLRASLAAADVKWVLAAVILQLLNLLLRAHLWRVILGRAVTFVDVYWAAAAGYFINNVLPLRLGEFVRVAALRLRSNIEMMKIFASMVIERAIDITIVLLLVILGTMVTPIPEAISSRFDATLRLVIFALAFGVLLLGFSGKVLNSLGAHKLLAVRNSFVDGLLLALRHGTLIESVALGLLSWMVSAVTYWCVMRGFIETPTLFESMFLTFVLVFAQTLPASPGAIGIFHFAGQNALVLPFGEKYSPEIALAIALVSHAIVYTSTTTIGFLGFLKVKSSLPRLRDLLSGKSDIRTSMR